MNKWKMRSIYPPNNLFRKISPFPPTFRHRFFEAQNKLLLRDFPFTLYERDENNRIRWLGFTYAFLYVNNHGKRVIRLERICSFLPKKFWRINTNEKIYTRLINECTNLAKFIGVDSIELEAYRKVGGEIYFPSTLSFVDSFNSPDVIRSLKRVGFQKKGTELVFALPVIKLKEFFGQTKTQGILIKSYGYSPKERRRYWSLWAKSPYCVEKFFHEEPDWELDYGIQAANDPRFVLFAWKDSKIVGFVHWLPNYYRVDETGWKTKSSGWILSQAKRVEGGKIFKLVVDPDFDSKDIRRVLCLNAVKTMSQCGLTKAQVGNISVSNRMMLDVVEELEGKRQHIIDMLAVSYSAR